MIDRLHQKSKTMYSDQDGRASKESQAIYNARVRRLRLLTSLLSGIGLGAAVLDGEYAQLELSVSDFFSLTWSGILWLVILLHSLWLHSNDNCSQVYSAGLRGSLLSIPIVTSRLLTTNSPRPLLQLSVAVILALVQIQFPRRPDVFTDDGKLVDRENGSSAFQRYSMQWCVSALRLAGNNVTIDKLPVLDYQTRSRSQPLIASFKTTLWNHIVAERYLGFAKQWSIMLVRSAVTFGSPYSMMRLLKSLEQNTGPSFETWVCLIGIGVCSSCETMLHYHLAWIQWSEMGIPIRAQLIMSLFYKTLRIKDSKQPETASFKGKPEKSEAINLVSSDTMAFSKFTAVNYILPFSFIKFLFAVFFLFQLLGWQSIMAALAVTVASVPIHTLVIKQERAARKNLTAARDKKTKATTEALHALRQIRFHGLETQWDERLERFRAEELKHLRKGFMASNIRSVWKLTAPLLVPAASICTFAYNGRSISPAVIFPMIDLLPHLQGTLGLIPMVLQDYLDARSNASRMEEYLKKPGEKRILNPSPSGRIVFHNACISWPSNETTNEQQTSHQFTLHDINLDFPVGELSIIHGKTGCGKSLLLSAILGEVDLLDGRIEAPSTADGQSIAFVSQTPWLQSGTVKDNILFGSPLDAARYRKVLNVCSLSPDLAVLPKGDETQIGLRGVKLSGGQRARVALARAIYSDSKVLVLDDIFSALDAHVSNDIFKALTGELCKGRTRILVTHQVSMCLPQASYFVEIQENTIGFAGPTEYVEDVTDIPVQEVEVRSSIPLEAKPKEKAITAKKPEGGNARGDIKVYTSYFTAAGGLRFTVVYLSGLVIKQLLGALTTWTMGYIHSTRSNSELDQRQTSSSTGWARQYVVPYLCSVTCTILFEFLFNLYSSMGSLRASKVLFREMTFRLLRMPLLWLDTTSIGGLLRHFTADIRLVDDQLLNTLSEFADCLVKVTLIVGFGLFTSRFTSVLTVTFLYAGLQVGQGYIKARSTVKRADAEPTAEILELFTSSTAGVSTIRAFGAVDRFVDQMHHRLDRLSTARRHFWIFNRWLGLQMSLIGILFSTGIGIFLLMSNSTIDTSLLGVSLSFSMGLSDALFKAVNSFGMLETYMDAAGAIASYTALETEDQTGNEVPEGWPSKGKVEVNNLEVSYAPNLAPVLRDISFTAQPGQRIGIVGRTGAGKSSLALALLRLIESRGGSISIDGIDISTIKLQSLRSKVAFIPQDPVLFSGTVRSNLDYFQQIPDEKLQDALRRIKLLAENDEEQSGPFTLDSPVSASGANMSQGQRQLLCLARILIQDPKIVILDEATSALDDRSDLLIQEAIRTEVNRTLIVVAHRLRTIASFDQVVVIDGGRIAEIGKPAELLRGKGMFYDLVQDSGDREFLTTTLSG